jgi:hypothetical protein
MRILWMRASCRAERAVAGQQKRDNILHRCERRNFAVGHSASCSTRARATRAMLTSPSNLAGLLKSAMFMLGDALEAHGGG